MKILVTGGAGYIGSQMAKMLAENGFEVAVFDNFTAGHEEAIRGIGGIRVIRGDILDGKVLEKVFAEDQFEAVLHFAGIISMAESMENPGKYFKINTGGGLVLLDKLAKFGVGKFIFSSTAGVYGDPVNLPISEDAPKIPTNPYGQSKLMVEQVLSWYSLIYGISSISLRYFNAAGASLDGENGEDHNNETHLIPLACKAALENREFTIYGNDYKTEDGTCIRDYVHVADLCEAHLLALGSLIGHDGSNMSNKSNAYNIGPGIGYSNLEVVEMVKKISQIDFPVVFGPRRPGDAAELVADCSKINKELGWQPKYSDLETIVRTAWEWHQKHPGGYEGSGGVGER